MLMCGVALELANRESGGSSRHIFIAFRSRAEDNSLEGLLRMNQWPPSCYLTTSVFNSPFLNRNSGLKFYEGFAAWHNLEIKHYKLAGVRLKP
jgi:hypothetical protein